MLVDLNGEILINPIDQTPITDNWKEYMKFRKNTHLSTFTKQELRERINNIKKQGRSIIDSATIIGRLVNELSVNENFNQQFKAVFPEIDRRSVLGMQLFIVLHEDDKKWIFLKPKNNRKTFKKANYVIS